METIYVDFTPEERVFRVKSRRNRWRRANLVKMRTYSARYRQRRRVAMTKDDIQHSIDYRKAMEKDPCYYCGSFQKHMQIDHFFPLAKGGTDHWYNLVRACEHCNKSKNARCGTVFILLGNSGHE